MYCIQTTHSLVVIAYTLAGVLADFYGFLRIPPLLIVFCVFTFCGCCCFSLHKFCSKTLDDVISPRYLVFDDIIFVIFVLLSPVFYSTFVFIFIMAANVAPNVAFNALFTRMGFNDVTRDVLVEEGYATMAMFADLDDDQIKELVRALTRRHQANPAVIFRMPAVNNLKAVVYWVQEHTRLTFPIDPDLIQVADMERVTAHRAGERERKALKETVPKPPPLKSLADWHKFWNLMKTCLSQHFGAALCSLLYLVRAPDNNGIVPLTQELFNGDHNDFLVNQMPLVGLHFVRDNCWFYDLLKTLVIDGPGWAFIQSFDTRRDGRAAVLALRRQCEGTAATSLRLSQAYQRISGSHYSGERAKFTFDDYVTVHQEGHNVLQECRQPVPENKKVIDFLAGISDSSLLIGVGIVKGDNVKLNDFDQAQTFLAQYVKVSASIKTNTRNLSSTDRSEAFAGGRGKASAPGRGSGRGGRGGGGRGGGRRGFTGTITDRKYSDTEYRSFTSEQRVQLYNMRQKAEASKARAVSAVGSDNEAAVKRGNAGDQFGKDAHQSPEKKAKQAMIASLEASLKQARKDL